MNTKDGINEHSLTTASCWTSPNVLEVSIILNEIKTLYQIEDKQLGDLIGVNNRTIRRWKNKSDLEPLKKSIIAYSEWAKIVLLARDKIIFGDLIECDKERIPQHIITNFKNFLPVSDVDMKRFIGKTSITKLTRGEIAAIFRWNPVHFSRVIHENTLTFSTVALVLILCGIDKSKVFYLD